MKKIVFSVLLAALLCGVLCSCGIVKSPDKYELSDQDSVVSITSVVGDREVKTTKTSSQYKKYVYKNVADTKADIQKYADRLVNKEGFTAKQRYNNLSDTGSLTFTKTSPSDSKFLIVVTITYNDSEYTVEAERQSKVL